MSKLIQQKAARIRAADIESFVATQGIERALAARCAVTELAPDELEQVSGGLAAQKDPFVLSGARPTFPDPSVKNPIGSAD